MSVLLCDLDTERALLAAVLATPATLHRLLEDESLRPAHFYYETHGQAFTALVSLADRGEHVDMLTLAAELERVGGVSDPREFVYRLGEQLPDSAAARTYARRLVDLHRRRELKLASALIADAADLGDAGKLAEAERLLTTPPEAEPSTWSGQELAERFADRLGQPAPQRYSWPFSRMDRWTGGGLRRKQVVLIGGWTSMGKSVLYDEILECFAAQGLRVHSYINEMSEEERTDRTVARLSGVPFSRIYARDLSPAQQVDVLGCLPNVKVGITECAGWTAHEIARHIRWNRWDVAGVDIIHEIAHREERDLAEIAQVLRSTAKQVGCALVACVHLNDQRVTSPKRPVPVLRDVRGSGMLVRGADIVLFVHRDDDNDGVPTDEGVLLAAKIRNGQPNAMGVVFRAEQMRFLPRAEVAEAPSW